MTDRSTYGEIVLGLPGVHVGALACDRDGVVWMACTDGAALLSYDRGQLRCYDCANSPIPGADISAIFVDRDDVKWFATKRGFVFTFDGRAFRVVRRPVPQGNAIAKIMQDRAGRLWLCGAEGYLIACYRGAEPDDAFTASVLEMRAYCVSRGRDGIFWISVERRTERKSYGVLLRFDGVGWNEAPGWMQPQLDGSRSVQPDARRGVTYASGGAGKLYRYRGEAWEPLSPADLGLGEGGLTMLPLDQSDNLWLFWLPAGSRVARLVRFDGERAVDFSEGTPLEAPGKPTQVVEDERGRIWITRRGEGVLMLDDAGWTVLPVVERPREPPWRRRDALDLLLQPEVCPDVATLLQEPWVYRGQKIRLVGRIAPGAEQARVTIEGHQDANNIFPDTGPVTQLLQRAGIDAADLDVGGGGPGGRSREPAPARQGGSGGAGGSQLATEARELVGFFEYEGGYGPRSLAPCRLMITEVYPHPCAEEERKILRERYRAALEPDHVALQAIRELVARWLDAMEQGSPEALYEVLDPTLSWRQGLLSPDAAARWVDRRFRLERPQLTIQIESNSATVRFHPRRGPGRARSLSPERKGIYEIGGLSLAKVGEAWRIRDQRLTFVGEEQAREHVRLSPGEQLNERRRCYYRHPLRPAARPAPPRFDRRAILPPATPEQERALREVYERFALTASALPVDQVMTFDGDAGGVFRMVRRAATKLLHPGAGVWQHLPSLPHDEVLCLTDLAQALRYSVTRLPAVAVAPPDVAVRLDEVYQGLRPALAATETGFVAKQIPEPLRATIRRALVAADLTDAAIALVAQLREGRPGVCRHPEVSDDDLTRLEDAALWLRAHADPTQRLDARDIRDRLWSLLHKRYRHLRTIAHYFHGYDFEAHAPDLLRAEPPSPDDEDEAIEI